MSEEWILECRCGWKHGFSPQEKGLQLECPECSRDLLVTDDPVEFRNRNVGAQEFQFAEESDDEPGLESAPPPPASAPTRIRGTAPLLGGRRPGPSRRKARRAARKVRLGAGPLPWVLVGALVIVLVGGWAIAGSKRVEEEARATELCVGLLDLLARGHYSAAGAHFRDGIAGMLML